MFQRQLSSELFDGLIKSENVSIKVDNLLSPSHTLVQISSQEHKGILYDIMRTLKDFNIQVLFGFWELKVLFLLLLCLSE